MSTWIALVGGGGLTAVVLALIGVTYKIGYHAGSNDEKALDADRRLTRLEQREGYNTPEALIEIAAQTAERIRVLERDRRSDQRSVPPENTAPR